MLATFLFFDNPAFAPPSFCRLDEAIEIPPPGVLRLFFRAMSDYLATW